MFTFTSSSPKSGLPFGSYPEEQFDPTLPEAPLSEEERRVAEVIYRQLCSYFALTDVRVLQLLFLRMLSTYAVSEDAMERFGPEKEELGASLLLYTNAVDLWQWLYNEMPRDVQALHLTR